MTKNTFYYNVLDRSSRYYLPFLVTPNKRILMPVSHLHARAIYTRSDGAVKIANLYGSRDALPIPLYIISEPSSSGTRAKRPIRKRDMTALLAEVALPSPMKSRCQRGSKTKDACRTRSPPKKNKNFSRR